MVIPQTLLEKKYDIRFQGKVPRILEEGWNYLGENFRNMDDYFGFLESLSEHQYNKFLYAVFFYWAHDLYRLIEGIEDPNIDGFMYQITLSIVEYLNESIPVGQKERIKDFFTNYFSDPEKEELKSKIIARPIGSTKLPQIESWEVLYEMRNEFIHNAKWFVMRFGDGFASLGKVKKRDGTEYLADIRVKFEEYSKLFWKAYLRYFGK